MTQELNLDLKKTALVVIDVQAGIAGRPNLAPIDGPTLVDRNNQLADAFVAAKATVVLVRVRNTGREGFNPATDEPTTVASSTPDEFTELALNVKDNQDADVVIVDKHNWGAFHGTDLDTQLRRRGIDTIILTGVASSIGVDTTAREGAQAGYNVVFVPEAMTDLTLRGHEFATEVIFPRLGKTRTIADALAVINK